MADNKHDLSSLPQTDSAHYEIVVAFSDEYKRETYFARNKQTGINEIPFNIGSHSKQVLKDLEEEYHLEGIHSVKNEGAVH